YHTPTSSFSPLSLHDALPIFASPAAVVESSFSVIVRYPTSALAVSPAASQARPASERNWARRNGYRAAAAAASYAVAASLGRSAFSYAAPSSPYVCARKYLSALGADRWSTSIACWVWPCASRACASRMLASWAPWVPEKFSTTWDSTLAASG